MKNKIEMLCLNAICDDYENLIQIKEDIQRSLGYPPEDKEIRLCLTKLVEKGYAEVFEYDRTTLKYVKSVLSNDNWDDEWFLITGKGRIELDKIS